MTVGLQRDRWHKYRWGEGEWLPGVTSAIGMLDKSGPLVGWARRETARYAVENVDLIARMVKDFGADTVVASVKTVTDREAWDKAATGSRVHGMIEEVLRAQHEKREAQIAPTDDERPFMAAFYEFERTHAPRWLTVEAMVCNLRYGYGGTLDGICVIDDAVTLLDTKTGKTLQPSMRLQLAALASGEFIGRAGDPRRYRIPKIERYALLHVRPEGADLVYQDVGPGDFEAFLACLRLWHWQQAENNARRARVAA